MANPKSDGRMIRKDISESDKFAALSPEAAVLFAMLIPHFNPYGKLNGGPGYIKEIVCPKIKYLTIEKIPALLTEIAQNTNVKWFSYDGRDWIHSLSFLSEHQSIEVKKLGKDKLPNYSATSQGIVCDHSATSRSGVVGQREREREREREGKSETSLALAETDSEKPGQGPSPSGRELDVLFQNFWTTFRAGWPLRNGKFIDEDACREYAARNPAKWNQWLSAAKNYAASREVQDGAVMNPMKFLTHRWQNWCTPEEEPLGAGAARAPDYSWRKTSEQDEKIFQEELQRGAVKEIPRPEMLK